MDAAAVEVHYAAQLERQGWAREGSASGTELAASRWLRVDDEGTRWVALLDIWRLDTGRLNASLRMDDVAAMN